MDGVGRAVGERVQTQRRRDRELRTVSAVVQLELVVSDVRAAHDERGGSGGSWCARLARDGRDRVVRHGWGQAFDERGYGQPPRSHVVLHGRGRAGELREIGEDLIDRGIELRSREGPIDEILQRAVVERLDLGMVHEEVHGVVDANCVAGSTASRRAEDAAAAAERAEAEHGIQIVIHEDETRIVQAAIHRVVIIVARVDAGLAVPEQAHHREMPQPLLDIDHGSRPRRGPGGGLVLAHHIQHADEVAPVVLAHVAAFEVGVLVRGWILATVAELLRRNIAHD